MFIVELDFFLCLQVSEHQLSSQLIFLILFFFLKKRKI